MKTGKLRWYFQTTHHDIWDYDATNPTDPVRPEREEGHRARGQDRLGLHPQPVEREAAVRHPGEEGAAAQERQHVRDAADPERRPVLAAVRHEAGVCRQEGAGREAVQKVGCIYTPYDDTRFVTFAPAALGGANWPPSAYSPDDRATCTSARRTPSRPGGRFPAEDQKLAGARRLLADRGPDRRARASNRAVEGPDRRDEHAQQPARLVGEVADDLLQRVTATAGNLVFTGTNEGYLRRTTRGPASWSGSRRSSRAASTPRSSPTR